MFYYLSHSWYFKKKKEEEAFGAQIIHKLTMPQTTWEAREISHLPILWALQMGDTSESWCFL